MILKKYLFGILSAFLFFCSVYAEDFGEGGGDDGVTLVSDKPSWKSGSPVSVSPTEIVSVVDGEIIVDSAPFVGSIRSVLVSAIMACCSLFFILIMVFYCIRFINRFGSSQGAARLYAFDKKVYSRSVDRSLRNGGTGRPRRRSRSKK